MGKTTINKSSTVDINESARQTQANFSEQRASESIGPAEVSTNSSTVNGDIVANTSAPVSQINTWKVMTVGDDGLKQALFNWINTTKEGVKVAPNVLSGRQKKLTFNFYGNMGKSIAPGEIGEFNLIFSYPPQIQPQQTGTAND